MIIYFIRHGEDKLYSEKRHNGWAKNNPLSPLGIIQIQKTIRLLKNKKIDTIFSSDLERAKQSADIISKKIGIPVNIDKRLRDLRRSIEMEGMHFSKFIKLPSYQVWMKNKNRQNFKLPDGESLYELDKRTEKFVSDLSSKHNYSAVLIISHNATITSLVKHLTGNVLKKEDVDFGKIFKVQNRKSKTIE